MELLLLLAWATWAASGPIAHSRKTEPLRIAERRQRSAQMHERRMARIGRRGGRPTVVEALSIRVADRIVNPRGGPARRAAADWWADSWLYATERRRARHARAAAGQLRRQRAARAVKAWATAAAARRRERAAQGATRSTQSDPWTQPRAHHQAHRAAPHPVPAPEADDDDIVEAELVDESTDEDDEARTVGGTPPSPAADPSTPSGRGASQPNHSPGGHQKPDHAEPEPEALASVHPIRPAPTSHDRPIGKDIVPMTTHTVTSGETLDPAAGLSFVNSVRESTEQIMSQIELSVSSLRERGVAGEPIELLERMREAFSVAVGSSQQAATHFQRHLSTQDQLLADPSLARTVHGTYVGTRT